LAKTIYYGIMCTEQEGLKGKCEDTDNPAVRDWMRVTMAMTALPTFAVPLIWQWLKCPPNTYCESTNAKLLSLSAYFERTWIGGDFPPSLWTHYDNNGPRTTNVAEGWHSSLNTQFGMPHLSLRVFLHWLQKCQYQVQGRTLQLTAGRSPKPRKAAYIKVDNDLWTAKLEYGRIIGQIFSMGQPQTWNWSMQQFHYVSHCYLRRCSYLLGCWL